MMEIVWRCGAVAAYVVGASARAKHRKEDERSHGDICGIDTAPATSFGPAAYLGRMMRSTGLPFGPDWSGKKTRCVAGSTATL